MNVCGSTYENGCVVNDMCAMAGSRLSIITGMHTTSCCTSCQTSCYTFFCRHLYCAYGMKPAGIQLARCMILHVVWLTLKKEPLLANCFVYLSISEHTVNSYLNHTYLCMHSLSPAYFQLLGITSSI